ncbi:MAG: hypothetical protein JJ901_10850 [Erythrobacter sp.]|uniref:hypothetical protein n=1 Tax=Erythrobacter sp. TaxID=1042 RepID=UPI001B2E3374|nr:hypothetical protein [Erythrobacter sp.]MBO6768780.1 hypothetical protein [Erythrobacter sp.]
MSTISAALALALTQLSAGAQGASDTSLPDLTLEQASALRCSVAFGLFHKAQVSGERVSEDYPLMAERGREFFVQTTARLMDDLGADRETIMGLVERESVDLMQSPQRLDAVMPACLLMLDASGI